LAEHTRKKLFEALPLRSNLKQVC